MGSHCIFLKCLAHLGVDLREVHKYYHNKRANCGPDILKPLLIDYSGECGVTVSTLLLGVSDHSCNPTLPFAGSKFPNEFLKKSDVKGSGKNTHIASACVPMKLWNRNSTI